MGFIKLECPSCGATPSIDESRDFCYCEFCGTRIEREKTIIEHRSEIKVAGLPTEESLLERADIFLDNGDWQNADSYYNMVLDINPRKGGAYIGLVMAKLRVHNLDELCAHDKDLNLYCNFRNAVKFSEGEEKEKYLQINSAVSARMNAKRESFEKTIAIQQSAYDNAAAMLDESERAGNAVGYIKAKLYKSRWTYSALVIPGLLIINALSLIIAGDFTLFSGFLGVIFLAYTAVYLYLRSKNSEEIDRVNIVLKDSETKKIAARFTEASAKQISADRGVRAERMRECSEKLSMTLREYSVWSTYIEREE